jgi:hypothetical protein
MESPKRAPADPAKRATVLAAVLGWLLSLAAARGVTIDPDVVLQLNTATLSTLSLRVVEKLVVSLSRPLVSGAAALMEVLSRVLLLLLALVLCAAPSHREAILQRARSFLRDHVEVAVRLSLRMSPAPSPPQALAELPTGAPPNVLVVGATGVGKSALIGAMSSQAEQHGLVLAAAEGLPSGRALEAYAKVARTPSLAAPRPDVFRGGAVLTQLCPLSQVRLGVIVWEASLTQPLGAYVQQYVEQMQAVVGNPSLSVVVVCNKTDVVPCPIPQLAELGDAQPFIAVSAERGTNLRHLFGLLEPNLSKPLSQTASTAGPPESSTASSSQGGFADRRRDSFGLARRESGLQR